ncbi:aldehyde dehydrogenase [Hyunsoonleella pacifica]|uniref:Aldehyde dehydrogenase n=1 Tax=Hyunsoonleella pacifica TaxID=1080224 RepID=A0A4Q9FUP9_9FLAO|nr:aldehyde dehydrogenase [Hyunsoonleella pacifica]TBN18989.1 aldehyde dehydrogenase [Hyunsoonleella pacifica]GGD06414.1 aldehyde dehydrogenase [Hyunsoonleella pacifica]
MKSIPKLVASHNALFLSQATKDIPYRLSLLKTLKQEIIKKEQDIFDALYKDFRKSEFETYISEFGLVISELNLAIKKLKSWSKPKRVRSSILTFPSKDYIYKEPYGAVLVIAPWNYPFLLAMEPLIMAIAAGNTVVLKPSELTENTSQVLTEIIKNVFPEDMCTSIEGGIPVATELLAQKWDYIFFTGSTKVGKIVAEAAAKHLTPVTLELGGKTPCIIDETIDVKLIARRLVWGKLLNGGQTCIAPDFVIVKSHIKAIFIEAIEKEITRRYGKTPFQSDDFPRIINSKNLKRLVSLIENENIIFGGKFDEKTNYLAPTLIDNPQLDSKIMTEEIFGPILPILVYDSEKDIAKIMSSIERPLAFYIFSKNNSFSEKLIRTYSFGGGVINDTLVHFGNPKLPFGGIGASGMGNYHGKNGFDTFSHEKSIMKRGTWLDLPLRYAPYKGKTNLLKKVFKYFS